MPSFAHQGLRRSALALGLALTFSAGTAYAQSSSGSIFGQVEARPGTTIVLQNVGTGLTREVPVDSSGRYRAAAMPVGTYRVSLQQDGQTLQTRDNVVLHAGTGTEVSFATAAPSAADAQSLEGISVAASALPAIDVSSVDTRTVLTSEQLSKIPVARDVTQAALLAPGPSAATRAMATPPPSAVPRHRRTRTTSTATRSPIRSTASVRPRCRSTPSTRSRYSPAATARSSVAPSAASSTSPPSAAATPGRPVPRSTGRRRRWRPARATSTTYRARRRRFPASSTNTATAPGPRRPRWAPTSAVR